MAGRPWEERLCLYIQASFCFVLLLTLDSARSFARRADYLTTHVDILVVEIVLALVFYAKGEVGAVLPILLGPAGKGVHGGEEECYGALGVSIVAAPHLQTVLEILLHRSMIQPDITSRVVGFRDLLARSAGNLFHHPEFRRMRQQRGGGGGAADSPPAAAAPEAEVASIPSVVPLPSLNLADSVLHKASTETHPPATYACLALLPPFPEVPPAALQVTGEGLPAELWDVTVHELFFGRTATPQREGAVH